MGDARHVFNKYVQHVLNYVNSTPSMAFKANSAWVMKLSSLYIIGSTKDATECYIDAHGGNYSADHVLDNLNFRVPAGVDVRFYQPAGYAFGGFKSELHNGAPQQHGGTADQDHDAGDECPNYMLTKFQDRHPGADAQTVQDQDIDYQGFQDIAQDAGITLKAAIHDIRKALPNITTFNCMFCRVDDTTAGLAQVSWNASPTTGGNW